MLPNKPQSNYSKRPVKKVRLLKFGPSKSKGLFEEYFYGFLAVILLGITIVLAAGGMAFTEALVTGLWIAAVVWFGWQLRRYFKEKSSPRLANKATPPSRAAPPAAKAPLSPNLKPMIGPQWPLKSANGASEGRGKPSEPGKRSVFVYERPTLPDRPFKLPANWPGQQDKKTTKQQDKKPRR